MNFEKYAKYYDLFYNDKNYSKEIKTIHKIIKLNKKDQILEVGCGTGKHTEIISSYVAHVDAIDKSKKMILEAKKKIRKKNIKFYNLDLLNLKKNKQYDKIIMLFHVFSYFVDNNSLRKIFIKLVKVLKPKGKIIFDYWNQDNVNKYGLKNSFKKKNYKNFLIERIGNVKKISKNRYSIKFIFNLIKNKKIKESFSETHVMRTFNMKSIIQYSKKNFNLKKSFSLNSKKKLSQKDFSACIILEKNK